MNEIFYLPAYNRPIHMKFTPLADRSFGVASIKSAQWNAVKHRKHI